MKKITYLLFLAANLIFAQDFTDNLVDSSTADALSTKIVDLDNDGDLDFVTTFYNEPGTTNTGKLRWYENDGMQNYTAHDIDTAINGAIYVSIADANNDGKIDLLVNAYTGNALYLYVNNGGSPLTFLPRITIDAAANGSNYSSANDLDGDGILDAISANYGGGELAWYKWDGIIGIVKNIVDASVPMINSVETGDIDGDSDMDLIVAADNEILWYENDGTGSFTKHTIPSSAGFNGALTAYMVDFNGDSNMDILASASSSDEVAWFENDGSENFTKHIVGTSIDYAAFGMAGDIDNDGDLDVVVSATNSDTLLWYENDGTHLSFTQHIIADASTLGDSYALDLNDIDADGDIDVALTSPGPNKFRWMENHLLGAPYNDLATNAIAISCGDVVTGNTTDATIDAQGDCGDALDDSNNLWYTFTGTGTSETITVSTCSTNSNFNTVIAIYTGTPGSLTCLTDNDNDFSCSNNLLSTVDFISDGTSTYYIKVQGFDNSEIGNFELSVTCAIIGTTENETQDFSFFPNPTKDVLTINANEKITLVTVFNIIGQEVKRFNSNSENIEINIANLTEGTYFVKAEIGNKIGNFKIIKQ